ncbi:MbtH family protein [Streptomyces sp. NPDC052101]|uniref:MbtH family protein n=1 Tax=Streptomyces sp. NPDC052101 TaxID=3155763 RepID=UPI00344620AB
MTTNPFENDELRFFVLRNDEEQHSIWPASIEVPAGWTVVHGETSRQDAIAYVDENWTDMRPKSLASAMDANRK